MTITLASVLDIFVFAIPTIFSGQLFLNFLTRLYQHGPVQAWEKIVIGDPTATKETTSKQRQLWIYDPLSIIKGALFISVFLFSAAFCFAIRLYLDKVFGEDSDGVDASSNRNGLTGVMVMFIVYYLFSFFAVDVIFLPHFFSRRYKAYRQQLPSSQTKEATQTQETTSNILQTIWIYIVVFFNWAAQIALIVVFWIYTSYVSGVISLIGGVVAWFAMIYGFYWYHQAVKNKCFQV